MVMTIMGVLIAIPIPSFLRAVEQSKLDAAAGHLRAIWAAQRLYRLEHGQFGTLADLAPENGEALIDPVLVSGSTYYAYSITLSGDSLSFVAVAQHPEAPRCTGSLSIDETGTLTNNVTYNGQAMTTSLESGS